MLRLGSTLCFRGTPMGPHLIGSCDMSGSPHHILAVEQDSRVAAHSDHIRRMHRRCKRRLRTPMAALTVHRLDSSSRWHRRWGLHHRRLSAVQSDCILHNVRCRGLGRRTLSDPAESADVFVALLTSDAGTRSDIAFGGIPACDTADIVHRVALATRAVPRTCFNAHLSSAAFWRLTARRTLIINAERCSFAVAVPIVPTFYTCAACREADTERCVRILGTGVFIAAFAFEIFTCIGFSTCTGITRFAMIVDIGIQAHRIATALIRATSLSTRWFGWVTLDAFARVTNR